MEQTLSPRQLRRWFGRIALTLLVTFVVSQLLSYLVVQGWVALTGQINYTLLIVFNDLCVYVPALILIPLLLRPIPQLPPLPSMPLSGQEKFLAIFFSLGSGYLFSFLTMGLIYVLESLTGLTSGNAVSNLESSLPPLVSFLAFAIVAPVAEEVIFRRLLLDRVRILGDRAAILIVGVAFALFHGNLNQTLYAFVLGAVFAAIVLMTNRLRYTIAIHMLINGISVLSTFADTSVLDTLLAYVILFSIFFSVVLFLVRRKHYTLEPGPLPFSGQEKARACFTSPWVWILLIGGLAFSAISIFL